MIFIQYKNIKKLQINKFKNKKNNVQHDIFSEFKKNEKLKTKMIIISRKIRNQMNWNYYRKSVIWNKYRD